MKIRVRLLDEVAVGTITLPAGSVVTVDSQTLQGLPVYKIKLGRDCVLGPGRLGAAGETVAVDRKTAQLMVSEGGATALDDPFPPQPATVWIHPKFRGAKTPKEALRK